MAASFVKETVTVSLTFNSVTELHAELACSCESSQSRRPQFCFRVQYLQLPERSSQAVELTAPDRQRFPFVNHGSM